MSLPQGVHDQDGRSICIPIQVSKFILLLSLQNMMGFGCLFSFSFFFLALLGGCGILVPQPGVEPGALAVRTLRPSYWTAREFRDFNF